MTSSENKPRPKRRRILFRLGALGLSLFLTLLLAEIALRVLGVTSEAKRHFRPGIYKADSELGWVLEPNYEGAHMEYAELVPTTTNSLGFRGPEWDATRQRAARRVLMLGDSVTFGRGVEDHETFPFVLEGLLRKRDPNVAVFNSGVMGFDTIQEADVLPRLEPIARPTDVIVCWISNDALLPSTESRKMFEVMDGHLVADVERYRRKRQRTDHQGLYASALYRFLRVRTRLLKDAIGIKRRRGGAVETDTLRYSKDALLRIQARCKAQGFKLGFVLIPSETELEPDADVKHLVSMAAFAKEHGLPILDLAAAWRTSGEGEGYFLSHDPIHLSARGCARVAEAISESDLLR